MELILCGHEDRYAVEQLCLSLFPQGTEGKAVSTLHRGKTWLTAVTTITLRGQTHRVARRIPLTNDAACGQAPKRSPCGGSFCSRASIWRPCPICRKSPPGGHWRA